MAILSTHTLNSVNGRHAGGIALQLIQCVDANMGIDTHTDIDTRRVLIDSATDEGGRFAQELVLSADDTKASYELVLQTGAYFARQNEVKNSQQILREVVVRFEMPDTQGRYHIPFMLAPHSYSVWWSCQ